MELVSYTKNNNVLLLFKRPSLSFLQLWIHTASIQFNPHLIKLQFNSYMMRFNMLMKFLLDDHVWPGHGSRLTSLHLLHLPKLFVFSGTNPFPSSPCSSLFTPLLLLLWILQVNPLKQCNPLIWFGCSKEIKTILSMLLEYSLFLVLLKILKNFIPKNCAVSQLSERLYWVIELFETMAKFVPPYFIQLN